MTRTSIKFRPLLHFSCISYIAIIVASQVQADPPTTASVSTSPYDQIVLDGNQRLKSGDFEGARNDAMKALALDGNRFEGYALESLALFKESKAGEAKTFMDLALEKVPASKKPQLEALAATIESVGSPAAAPSAEVSTATQSHPAEIDQLKGDDRLEYETLLAMLSDADKASDLDSRHKMLGDFMDKSAGFLKAHPDLVHLWVARAAVAVELNRAQEGWEAGQKLKALGLENSTDPEIVKVMVELNERDWLGSQPPATPSVTSDAAQPQIQDNGALSGVTVADIDPQICQQFQISPKLAGHVIVTDVAAASKASQAGLQKGDIILFINKRPLKTADQAVALSNRVHKDQISLIVLRNYGKEKRVISVDNTGNK